MAAMPTDGITRRFAVACGVLSQYVRNGSAPATPPQPFLKQAPAGPAAAQAQEMIASAPQQLTIFYGGRVVVLDACPPDKAAELIRLAVAAAQGPQPPEQALVDMPIARKASLRRFLAKRKDRSSASSPAYDDRQDDEPPAPKKGKMAAAATREEPSSSWLALGSLCSMHGR